MLNKDIDQSVRKWLRGVYQIATYDKNAPSETGWLFGAYGMTSRVSFIFRSKRVHTITHLNTGYSVLRARCSFAVAKKIVEYLSNKFDARRIKSPKSRLVLSEYKKAVMATKAKFKDAF